MIFVVAARNVYRGEGRCVLYALLTTPPGHLPQEEIEDDEFFTARNTMVQRYSAQARGGAGDKRGGVEPSGDGTITGDLDLGTLVIIDDEEEMDTMKSELVM